MGVPAFFRWISIRYPKVVINAISPADLQELQMQFRAEQDSNEIDLGLATAQLVHDHSKDLEKQALENPKIDNLYLDMNGIIHPCFHPQGKPQPQTEAEIFNNIFEYTDKVINTVRPEKVIYFAIDGVAPVAKINQQRSRRFRAAMEKEENTKLMEQLRQKFSKHDIKISEEKDANFDQNMITPGTDFMARLQKIMQQYIISRLNNDPRWKGRYIVFSDSSVPGEGEHKILDFIRSQRAQPGFNPNTSHCIYGADADLIMLALSTHELNFFIIREAFLDPKMVCRKCGQNGHTEDKCRTPPGQQRKFSSDVQFNFVNIQILREYWTQEFSGLNLAFEYDFERIVDDLVLILFIVGNDFLPHLPGISIRDGAIDVLFMIYQSILPALPGYLTDESQIIFKHFDVMFQQISLIEESFLQKKSESKEYHKKRNQDEDDKRSKMTKEEKKNLPPRYKEYEIEDDIKILESEVAAPAINEEEKNKLAADAFKKMISNQQRKQDMVKQDAYQDLVALGRAGFKQRYYQQKFKATDDSEMADLVKRIKQKYIEGLQWVFNYYYKGCPDWEWFYPFHYAPFASDLINCDTTQIEFEVKKPVEAVEQLMSVFPLASSAGVPACFRHLMADNDSPIIDFYPPSFQLDLNDEAFMWMAVVLLPFIDRKRLRAAMLANRNLSADEEKRNKMGTNFIFFNVDEEGMLEQFYKEQNRHKVEKLTFDAGFMKQHPIAGQLSGFIEASNTNMSIRLEAGLILEPIEANRVVQIKYEKSSYARHLSKILPGAIKPRPIVNLSDITSIDRFPFQGMRMCRLTADIIRSIHPDVLKIYTTSDQGYRNFNDRNQQRATGGGGQIQQYIDRESKKRTHDQAFGDDQRQGDKRIRTDDRGSDRRPYQNRGYDNRGSNNRFEQGGRNDRGSNDRGRNDRGRDSRGRDDHRPRGSYNDNRGGYRGNQDNNSQHRRY